MTLAELITSHRQQILKSWEEFVRRINGSLPRWVLRDHAPLIVDLIAQQMVDDPPPSRPQPPLTGAAANDSSEAVEGPLGRVTAIHVKLRIDSGFELAQIVSEYCTLRACVIDLWRAHDATHFTSSAVEISKFNEIIDALITAAVTFYREQESQYRDRFLGMLSHDLRNPINAVELAVGVLLEQGPDEAQLKTLAVIKNSVRRLTRMVDDLLDFSRGRLGSPMPLTLRATDLGAIAREVIDEVQVANPTCKIDFHDEGDLCGHWDPDRLKQVVSNLLINANQYGNGEPIGVRLENKGDVVILEVRNRGRTIPAESIPTLFDPLVRG